MNRGSIFQKSMPPACARVNRATTLPAARVEHHDGAWLCADTLDRHEGEAIVGRHHTHAALCARECARSFPADRSKIDAD